MKSSSGSMKMQGGETSKDKGKKEKTKEASTWAEERKLNQDLLDQLPGSIFKPKRSVEWKLEDNYGDVGDVYTTIRSYELFMFHYHRHEKPEPICNPWKLSLGKLVVPNVYVDVDILKLLAQHYESKKRAICH